MNPFDTKLRITDNLNLIGDAAGNNKTAQALVAKMPSDAFTLFLGDLNDRGPSSKQLIQYIMDNPEKMDSTHSNHGEMFTDFYKRTSMPDRRPRYEKEIFLMNGGGRTLSSYRDGDDTDTLVQTLIPKDHIDWLDGRPMYRYTDGFFFSHAPIMTGRSFEQITSLGEGFYPYVDAISRGNLLWNRYAIDGFHPEIGPKISVYGHNSRSKPVLFCKSYRNGIKITSNDQFHELLDIDKGECYGICIDTSPSEMLTGLHLPTMTFYYQDYID